MPLARTRAQAPGTSGGVSGPDIAALLPSTIYFDAVGGLDAGFGTLASPYKTLWKHNSLTPTAGSTIKFKHGAGQYFNHAIFVTVALNIIYTTYGDTTSFEPVLGYVQNVRGASTAAWTSDGFGAYHTTVRDWNGVRPVRAAKTAAASVTRGTGWYRGGAQADVGVDFLGSAGDWMQQPMAYGYKRAYPSFSTTRRVVELSVGQAVARTMVDALTEARQNGDFWSNATTDISVFSDSNHGLSTQAPVIPTTGFASLWGSCGWFCPAPSNLGEVCKAQSAAGAGNLTINGDYASGGVATFAEPTIIRILSAANDSSRTFTVTGTIWDGSVVAEGVTGENNGTAHTTNRFKTVTQVAINGASAGNVTVGAWSFDFYVFSSQGNPYTYFSEILPGQALRNGRVRVLHSGNTFRGLHVCGANYESMFDFAAGNITGTTIDDCDVKWGDERCIGVMYSGCTGKVSSCRVGECGVAGGQTSDALKFGSDNQTTGINWVVQDTVVYLAGTDGVTVNTDADSTIEFVRCSFHGCGENLVDLKAKCHVIASHCRFDAAGQEVLGAGTHAVTIQSNVLLEANFCSMTRRRGRLDLTASGGAGLSISPRAKILATGCTFFSDTIEALSVGNDTDVSGNVEGGSVLESCDIIVPHANQPAAAMYGSDITLKQYMISNRSALNNAVAMKLGGAAGVVNYQAVLGHNGIIHSDGGSTAAYLVDRNIAVTTVNRRVELQNTVFWHSGSGTAIMRMDTVPATLTEAQIDADVSALLNFDAQNPAAITGERTSGSAVLANTSINLTLQGPSTTHFVGAAITGTGIPASTTILSYTSTAITMSANATSGTSTTTTLTIGSNFTVGQVVTGAVTGAVGTVVTQVDSGATGYLYLNTITGAFADNERITDPLGGWGAVNGVLQYPFICKTDDTTGTDRTRNPLFDCMHKGGPNGTRRGVVNHYDGSIVGGYSIGGTLYALAYDAVGRVPKQGEYIQNLAGTAGGWVRNTLPISLSSATLYAAGSGYAVNDTITLCGGDATTAAVITVDTVSGSAIATFHVTTAGSYGALPLILEQASTSGGGSGAKFHLPVPVETVGTVVLSDVTNAAGFADNDVLLGEWGANITLNNHVAAGSLWPGLSPTSAALKLTTLDWSAQVTALTTLGQDIIGSTTAHRGILIHTTASGSTGIMIIAAPLSQTFQVAEHVSGSVEGSGDRTLGTVATKSVAYRVFPRLNPMVVKDIRGTSFRNPRTTADDTQNSNTTVSSASASDGFTCDSTAGTITRQAPSGQSFITDGIVAGNTLVPNGFGGFGNAVVVESLTATVITCKSFAKPSTTISTPDTNATLRRPGRIWAQDSDDTINSGNSALTDFTVDGGSNGRWEVGDYLYSVGFQATIDAIAKNKITAVTATKLSMATSLGADMTPDGDAILEFWGPVPAGSREITYA